MKKIVLKVVKQCVGTDGVEPDYIRAEILPEFFKHFWVRRMALDRRNYRALVETTVEVAGKVGSGSWGWGDGWGSGVGDSAHSYVQSLPQRTTRHPSIAPACTTYAASTYHSPPAAHPPLLPPAHPPLPQVGCSEIVGRIVEDLKDESEPYRCAGGSAAAVAVQVLAVPVRRCRGAAAVLSQTSSPVPLLYPPSLSCSAPSLPLPQENGDGDV